MRHGITGLVLSTVIISVIAGGAAFAVGAGTTGAPVAARGATGQPALTSVSTTGSVSTTCSVETTRPVQTPVAEPRSQAGRPVAPTSETAEVPCAVAAPCVTDAPCVNATPDPDADETQAPDSAPSENAQPCPAAPATEPICSPEQAPAHAAPVYPGPCGTETATRAPMGQCNGGRPGASTDN